MTMHTTDWKEYAGGTKRIRVKYGMNEQFAERNNQPPYIAVTGEIQERHQGPKQRRWYPSMIGTLDEEISKHFPELRDLVPWHFVAEPGVPMHYLENGQYWWEFVLGTSKWDAPANVDPVSAFKNTILYGILPSDAELEFTDDGPMLDGEPVSKALRKDIRPWLKPRLPGLHENFDKIVRKYDLKGPTKNPTRTHNPGPTSAALLVGRLKF